MADFSLEGLLGNIGSAFSGGGNYLDEYLTPEQRAAMQRNAMLAASAALLKAGGESTRRIGIGEALGGAFEAGQAGYEKAQTGALTQMAMKQKMEEAKRAKALNAQIAGIIGTPTENESPDITANKLMQAGRAAMAGQDFTRGFDLYRQAREVNPRDEVQGAPFEGTDAQGNPIMLQQMKGGTIRPVSGYGVKQGPIGQPFEVSGPDGKPMLVQQLPNGTLREVSGVSAKQAAPGQPFEVTGPDGKPMLVQQMPDGRLRQVIGATPKQAAPSQPFEVTGPDGKPMLVQQMPDGSLREVSGVSPKQAAPGEPFEVTGPDGKPLLVQKMPDGSLREVSGFAPKQEVAAAPVEVTGPDGKPMLVTPQRGGGYTPVVGIGPKLNLSEKTKQLAELGLPPTLENFQLLESSPNEIKLLNRMGMDVNMANVERLRRAGATNVRVGGPILESAEQKGMADFHLKMFGEASTAAGLAQKTLPSLEIQSQILNKGFTTGFGTEVQKAGASVLAALGVPEAAKFATDAQTFLAATQQAVLQKQLEQKGPQTEADSKRVTQTGAQLGNTVQANQFLIDVAREQLNRDIERKVFLEKWWDINKTLRGADNAWFSGAGGQSLFDRPGLKKYAAPVQAPSVGGFKYLGKVSK